MIRKRRRAVVRCTDSKVLIVPMPAYMPSIFSGCVGPTSCVVLPWTTPTLDAHPERHQPSRNGLPTRFCPPLLFAGANARTSPEEHGRLKLKTVGLI